MRVIPIFFLLIVLAVIGSAAYTVEEWQQVVITRFGKPVGEPITTPGLKFKIPVVDTVHAFDKRFLEWDGEVNEVPTKEKRFILVDTYARWRITDPLKFFQRLKNERGAKTRLDGILNGETRDAVARHNLVEVVRTSNRAVAPEALLEEGEGEGAPLQPIDVGREEIRQEILANAKTRVGDLGIEILDVQFKRINYVEEVRRTVYERMVAERRRIADRFRSEGERESLRIRGEKERELKRIRSEAYRRAQEITGQADAKATEVYAGAYDHSADSRNFYTFLKTMESYRRAFDDETSLIMSTDSEFFQFLERSGR